MLVEQHRFHAIDVELELPSTIAPHQVLAHPACHRLAKSAGFQELVKFPPCRKPRLLDPPYPIDQPEHWHLFSIDAGQINRSRIGIDADHMTDRFDGSPQLQRDF
jgi:hypothetical protein